MKPIEDPMLITEYVLESITSKEVFEKVLKICTARAIYCELDCHYFWRTLPNLLTTARLGRMYRHHISYIKSRLKDF